ncbi:hypothetical protein [Propionivibrio sp.]|uniref:hypothetical protein n=1 Tax=Propionivibrio sp. TaxID=2212460 RepID=UPI0025E75F58|nr:hypothetical protein [Propionivibrio sp.]MBK7356013.1 hypothetical protein [Propionivibrio sp.]MBK8400319.1 hypothetical protein [Propionivibrio sp.]MBK8892978.1 hypothetical protein [Propionivibrio sp.]MBL0207335.1 hypothetical protein [Propionivibrio sp.]
MNTNFDPAGSPTHGVLTRILSVLVGVVVLTAAFMFSLVIFAVVAVAGLIFGFYFWWKTRELRRQMREQAAEQTGGRYAEPAEAGSGAEGEIIEGEAVRVAEVRDRPAGYGQ